MVDSKCSTQNVQLKMRGSKSPTQNARLKMLNLKFLSQNVRIMRTVHMVGEEVEEEAKEVVERSVHGGTVDVVFSPRFKSLAAMAGWDEEALLVASLVVEDTPERKLNKKRPFDAQIKTPPTNSRRKRRANQKEPMAAIPSVVLNLDDDMAEVNTDPPVVSKDCVESTPKPAMPCLERLREELSCAICLEICYEPSTTVCGHSFCKSCLKSAADKCGKKCPKCRQLISNARSCSVNTVLWNTIQLLFPREVKAKRISSKDRTDRKSSNEEQNQWRGRGRRMRSGGATPSQDEDAALALRLQREEFMGAFREPEEEEEEEHRHHTRSSLSIARANLRAMATRAANLRTRYRS